MPELIDEFAQAWTRPSSHQRFAPQAQDGFTSCTAVALRAGFLRDRVSAPHPAPLARMLPPLSESSR